MTRNILSELELDLQVLKRGLSVDAEGGARLSEVPSDPHFGFVYSGRYWQISRDGVPVVRSPSLWAEELHASELEKNENLPKKFRLPGPDEQDLIALADTVNPGGAPSGQPPFQVLAAVKYEEIITATRKFAFELWTGLGGLTLLSVLAAAAHITVGLRPFLSLRNELAAIRSGAASRIQGIFPNEVMPLVDETNALLEAQETALEAARTRSGTLAHGLKTPLAVMAAQSRRVRRLGEMTIADEIDRQVEAMRRHVERELARSRIRGVAKGERSRIDASAAAKEIAAALQILPEGQKLRWKLALEAPLLLSMERSDYDDIMGNLLDNARKWAKSLVEIKARKANGSVYFSVEDDGPGVSEGELDRIVQRGERAETSVPGTGLGLAIVHDLVLVYGGKLELTRSPLGGLKVSVCLPDRDQPSSSASRLP